MSSSYFPFRPQTEWCSDGESMVLTAPFFFVEASGTVWECPPGSVVNGASIPRFFWRLIGSPLTGKYRLASIPHDVHCDLRERPSREVHAMFYRAMRAAGVCWPKAWVMWAAVRIFGPRFKGNGDAAPAD